jgi:small-conductance mechanosensitive channel
VRIANDSDWFFRLSLFGFFGSYTVRMDVMDILNRTLFDNSVQNWLIALGILVGVFLLLTLFKRIFKNRLMKMVLKSRTALDDYIVPLLKGTRWFTFLALGIYLGSLVLIVPENYQVTINKGIRIILTIQVGFWGMGLISFFISQRVDMKIKEDQGDDATTLDALGLIGKIVLWIILTLVILDNLDVEVSSLVASLGIGGIAVALAVQNILGDLFSSLTIALDKPFVIGDFVVVDDFAGDVEDIGLKSTRIRSLSGEELIFSNSDLLSSRIRNYKRLDKRRVAFEIGVTYGTPLEKLKLIPNIVEEIITDLEQVQFDRAHFKALGDYALDYEIIYFLENPDYSAYMDIQQTINLELYRHFESEGISFAYPTQTLILEQ